MKEVGLRAKINHLNKYLDEHYNREEVEFRPAADETQLKFALPDRIITLSADIYGRVTESERKRKGFKNISSPGATEMNFITLEEPIETVHVKLFSIGSEPIDDNVEEDTVQEEFPVVEQMELFVPEKESGTCKNFKEDDFVQNIYDNNLYRIVSIEGNVAHVMSKSESQSFVMALADLQQCT